MILKKAKKAFVLALLVMILAASACWYAPDYLSYSDAPEKSEAVVLFLGPDFAARQKEAGSLFRDGYAEWVIIPAYNRMISSDQFLTLGVRNRGSLNPSALRRPYPHYFEDTHIEALEAKKFMDGVGMKKALFVSSPSHIRRIRLIASRIFPGSEYTLRFVPTRYEEPPSKEWLWNRARLKQMSLEYVKIAWFSIYSLFA